MEPIRIAQIIGTLPGGGVKNVMFNYYRKIDKNRYQFDFYYDSEKEVELPQDIIDMGARFYRIENHKNIFKCISDLRKHFRENRYEIVHSGMNTLSFISLYAAKKENVKIRIAHNHSVPGGNELARNVLKNIFRYLSDYYANVYFACSRQAGKWMFGDKNFFVMNNSIDFDKYNKVNKKEVDEIINKYNLKDKFVIGNIGRLTYAKNHVFMFEILKKLKEKKDNAVLLLVGDGELRTKLNDLVNTMGLKDSVIFTGNIENPQSYYHVMDLVLVPSIFEGFCLTLLEAQLAGIPALISDNIPRDAIVCDSGVEVLNINNNIDEWVDKILELKDQKLVYNENKDNYDINKSVKVLEDKYDALLHM